jgi:cytochrome P450
MRDFEFQGLRIPAGTGVDINPLYTHFMREIWPDPDRFDPLRFDPEASRARHKFAYVPFGGGAHMCLGLNFASMQAKCFTWHFFKVTRLLVNHRMPTIVKDFIYPYPYPRHPLGDSISFDAFSCGILLLF